MHHYRWLLVICPRPYFRAIIVVNEQLMLHLRINDLLPEHQSAYRSCHSTESALLKVTSDALLVADQGKLTLLGMLDMSAVFDCVDHIILVRRLNVSFGIDENALEWIVSYYITGRRQYVRYNGRTSEISVVECGVPQGSVLGPLYIFRPFYSRCRRYR